MESFAVFTVLLLNCTLTAFCAYALAKAVSMRDPSDRLSEKLAEWLPVILAPTFFILGISYFGWGLVIGFRLISGFVE